MKRIYLLLIFLYAFTAIASAQDTSQNYVRTRTMLKDNGSTYIDGITYYDGLGRPLQTVQKTLKDDNLNWNRLATLQQYDAAGRETNAWLPIVASSDFTDPISFKSSAPSNYGNDAAPYSKPVYESSPIKRVLQAYGPGAAWHDGHPVSTAYTMNVTSAPYNCTNYSVSSTGALVDKGVFTAAQLYIVQSKEEDGNTSYTFTDKLGRTLLDRRMKGSEAHDTYYVYDDSNRLCFVLQPMYQTSNNLDQYAFQYRYDANDNCTWKKLPGAQYTEYVYDGNDRLIFSQDGNQRAVSATTSAQKWTFYEYDNMNRLTRQGECTGKSVSSNQVVLVRNFYDSYTDFRTAIGNDSNYPNDASGYSRGNLTGSIITVQGGSTTIKRAYYYDIKRRVIKTVQNNLMGGYDVTSNVYSFTDKPATVTHTHTASGKTTRTEVYTYTYDHADRISKVQHTLGGITVTLTANTYDNLGRLSTKSLHGAATNKLTYAYNLRSWLTGISSTRFTQNLYYNTGVGTPKYNGNISSMTSKAGDESIIYGHEFTYDELNRMTNAAYGETAAINTNPNRFSEKITGYDKNGNITALKRYGRSGYSSYGMCDDLTYTLNGNQVTRVDDMVSISAGNDETDFKDNAKQANEYTYDANGNLTKDLNKRITGITYNVLNLPSLVTFNDGSTITYTYAADGTKLRTVHKTGSTTSTTDYCGNVIYENGTQKLLLTEEGYVNLTGTQQYHYYLKDHQGNNRVVINQSGTVEETNHYYPFGGLFASTTIQPYKYNGKEYDTKKGLNWYDYGARMYDPTLGRFTTVDPLAEKYYSISSYVYCLNNPIKYVDPSGGKVVDPTGKQITYENGNWSSNATAEVKKVGEAMMRNKVGEEQFLKMMSVEHPISIGIQDKTPRFGLLGVSKVTTSNGKIEKVEITLYNDAIEDITNIVNCSTKGEIVERYRNNMSAEQLQKITSDDVLGATATHESVHAVDEKSNAAGELDKSKRETNPVAKEVEYIKQIRN